MRRTISWLAPFGSRTGTTSAPSAAGVAWTVGCGIGVAAPVLLGLVLVWVLISKPLAVLLPVGLVRFGGSALLRRRA